MTCENRTSKKEKRHTHTHIESKPLVHRQARYMAEGAYDHHLSCSNGFCKFEVSPF